MSRWNTLRTIRTKRFAVSLMWAQEEDEDLSWLDAAGRAKLDAGEWTNCCFRVSVSLDGRTIADDYLGNSVYEDPADFGREHYGHNKGQGRAYFPDMVREAVMLARRYLAYLPAPPRMRTAA